MYGLLRGFLPKAVADALVVLWYLLLIFLAVALSESGNEEFRYLNI